jgi:hypothetical protein
MEKQQKLETFYEQGKLQAKYYLNGDILQKIESSEIYNEWYSQNEYDVLGNWNDRRFAFLRGWNQSLDDQKNF